MPEFRKDPVTDRWVIIATERAKRPQRQGGELPQNAPCPFCAGNENLTPPEVLVLRDPSGPSWTVRVVPNKYPALAPDGSGVSSITDTPYEAESGTGAHEVIIETPSHVTDMALLSETQFAVVLRAYRNRILELKNNKRFRYGFVYKNQGAEAGATLEHVHSQLIAMPMIPKLVLKEINAAKNYYAANRRCLLCDILQKESRPAERFVGENGSYLVMCPFAARFPYETWILPKKHGSLFEQNTDEEDHHLAQILRETLIRLNQTLGGPAFNYVIHSSPFQEGENHYYHWHLEILPKLIRVAGFEWGSGSYINTVTPEESARSLRAALP
jgi:UDPglucose--hexose-1-phosphate uridylyltransferase